MRKFVTVFMLINLWITFPAWGWGELGHRLVAEYGSAIVDANTLSNCHISTGQLVSHTNDPDKVWRQKKRDYPREAEAHFFHIDRQPNDWRARREPKDLSQGFLVYRITNWVEAAKKLRTAGNWDELAQKLYGISHYIGDIAQPLHVHHDYDGVEAGLPDLHSQFETKMLNRYEADLRKGISGRLSNEKIPALWNQVEFKTLIFDTAQQSYAKANRLFEGGRAALQLPKQSKKRKPKPGAKPRFVKKLLWDHTGTLAVDQLTLAARLWAHTLNLICK
jgi:hypothetical protein